LFFVITSKQCCSVKELKHMERTSVEYNALLTYRL